MKKLISLLGRSKAKDHRILMLGLDNAGKTTILYRLKQGEVVQTTPTVGFNVENVSFNKVQLSVWDVGGQDHLRNLWCHYFDGSEAVVFVVDSNDVTRLKEAREELFGICQAEDLPSNVCLLILANKQDLPNAMNIDDLKRTLELEKLPRKWHLQGVCAQTGKGLDEGFEWLGAHLLEQQLAAKKK